LGDFVISGGEFAAMCMIDAIARLQPGVIGDEESLLEESFCDGILEYSHYTRPENYMGLDVPTVLMGGNHKEINKVRALDAIKRTRRYRPELLPFSELNDEERQILYDSTKLDKGKRLKLAIALLHYPMRDKEGNLVCTSLTNMDLHDISRSAATFGAERYFLVTPLKSQREIAQRVMSHWISGFGAKYNANRKEAFLGVTLVESLMETLLKCEEMWNVKPIVVITTASERGNISVETLAKVAESLPVLLLFGTGWGFDDSVFDLADFILESIIGVNDFNHLSVRSAVAIFLERLTKVDRSNICKIN
jgi:tRNA (guanine37-N1)-methyltransferase